LAIDASAPTNLLPPRNPGGERGAKAAAVATHKKNVNRYTGTIPYGLDWLQHTNSCCFIGKQLYFNNRVSFFGSGRGYGGLEYLGTKAKLAPPRFGDIRWYLVAIQTAAEHLKRSNKSSGRMLNKWPSWLAGNVLALHGYVTPKALGMNRPSACAKSTRAAKSTQPGP
jgi:hypothetical protein